jgi:hypothetical protein
LCLGGDGLLTEDCTTGVEHYSKISVLDSGYLRSEQSERCLVPVANEENARVTSGDCESIEDG